MDNPGWHARKKAARAKESALPASRGPDGHFCPVEAVELTEDVVIGGWVFSPTQPHSPHSTQPDGHENVPESPSSLSSSIHQVGYPFIRHLSELGLHDQNDSPRFYETPSSQLKPVERSEKLNVKRNIMGPYLEFICGPLLRYDTIDENGVWHGAALIVTVDAESTYGPYPKLTYSWNPADPMGQHNLRQDSEHLEQQSAVEEHSKGTELYVYSGRSGTYTFWRFLIQIPLSDFEMKIQYTINDGIAMYFFVPGRHQTMRLAAYSCNGFSAGVNPDEFCGHGSGFQSGYDPLWVDLLAKHAEQAFHLLVGGGDQIYCDGVVCEPELQEWINHPNRQEKMQYPITQEMLDAIDRFYFNHYCKSFRSGAFARASSSIPMVNMLDDHDLVDGFGSYPDELQNAPVFKTIGSRGYFFYLLFQCFINVDKDGKDDRSHPIKSTIIGAQGAYIPHPSHSFLTPIGPTAWLLMLDCRAERKLEQVCSKEQYENVFTRMNELPSRVEHLIVQLGIPIAYPRMTFLETALSSKLNPLVALGRSGAFGLGGFVNQFNGDADLLDDLNDHWTSKRHMAERNQFIERLQKYALNRRTRISFLAGDVHSAAVGVLETLNKGWRSSALDRASDHRYMLNVISSAIVNTPPSKDTLTLVHAAAALSKWRHGTMHYAHTDEGMVALFDQDTNGSKPKSQYIMGRRNWCCITLHQPSGDLSFDIRVEKEKGYGETVGYCKVR